MEPNADLYIGTSGWGYPEWHGPVYPHELKPIHRLAFYDQLFKTVELNTSFYHNPRLDSILRWAKTVSEGFRFAVKLPQRITHEKKLVDTQTDVQHFMGLIDGFGPKIGPILIQLPPSFDADLSIMRKFLKILPDRYRYALEVRHPSWLKDHQFFDLLTHFDIAYCIVDEPLLPPVLNITTDFTYIRWHGHGKRIWYDYKYQQKDIETWSSRVIKVADQVKTVYGYFNNHFHGYAINNCRDLLNLLGQSAPDPRSVDIAAISRPKDQSDLLEFFKANDG